MTKNLKKNLQLENIFFFFLSKVAIYILISRPPQRKRKLQEKPSALDLEHAALQNMEFLYFFLICGSFLPSWFRIRICVQNAGPDPATLLSSPPLAISTRSSAFF
jgi:hypothetical protein